MIILCRNPTVLSFRLKLARKFPALRQRLMRGLYRKKGLNLDELVPFKTGKFFLYCIDGIYIPAEGLRDDVSLQSFSTKAFNESLYFHKPLPGETIVDLGAGLGEETLVYSKMIGDAGKVIAVEAHPHPFGVLAEMTRKNKLKNVIAAQYAIGPVTGETKIGNPGPSYESAFTGNTGTEVSSITLAGLFQKFGLQKIDLLKSNIEGAERYLFVEDSYSVFRQIRYVAIACHDFRFKKEKNDFFRTKEITKEALKKAGFEIHLRSSGIDYLDDWIYGSNKFS